MKGQFYSIMMALFIIPILALIVFYSQTHSPLNIATSIRSDELNYFSQSTEEDLSRFLDINGKRAMISAVSMVLAEGVGLDDSQLRLTELIENGTLYGDPAPLVDNKNIKTWMSDITGTASNLGFRVVFFGEKINVSQQDSLSVLFNATVYLNISDDNAGMYVLRNITVSVPVSLDGVEDPLFPMKTHGSVSRFIKISPYNKSTAPVVGQSSSNITTTISGYAFVKKNFQAGDIVNASTILVTDSISGKEPFINSNPNIVGVVCEGDLSISLTKPIIAYAAGATSKIGNGSHLYLDGSTKAAWDLGNLTSDINNGYYHSSTRGASFMDRLQGSDLLSAKYQPYGLESFVYLPAIEPADLSASVLDYEYWRGAGGSLLRSGRLQSYDYSYSWFRISGIAAADYGVGILLT